jgi:hypothetical protein
MQQSSVIASQSKNTSRVKVPSSKDSWVAVGAAQDLTIEPISRLNVPIQPTQIAPEENLFLKTWHFLFLWAAPFDQCRPRPPWPFHHQPERLQKVSDFVIKDLCFPRRPLKQRQSTRIT